MSDVPADLAAAHAAVTTALTTIGGTPVDSDLDREVAVLGPAYRVGPPTATAQIGGGLCAAWQYEVPVAVISGADTLDTLVDLETPCPPPSAAPGPCP